MQGARARTSKGAGSQGQQPLLQGCTSFLIAALADALPQLATPATLHDQVHASASHAAVLQKRVCNNPVVMCMVLLCCQSLVIVGPLTYQKAHVLQLHFSSRSKHCAGRTCRLQTRPTGAPHSGCCPCACRCPPRAVLGSQNDTPRTRPGSAL
jgi:hypothetical protein